MSSNSHIQEIMLRYLNGESSAAESRTLQEWISESDANREEFDLTKRLWTDSINAAMLPVDTEKAWKRVSAQITDKKKTPIVQFSWKKTLTIAASVILIAGSFYYFFQPGKTKWNTILAQAANKEIRLPDGTAIMLRKGAKLSIPENYGNKNRLVQLEGEAFFEVQHNSTNPFSIQTSRSIIRDIGTAFLVQNSDSMDRVSVMEGEVSIASLKKNTEQVSVLAGESAVLQNTVLQKAKADTTNLLSWNSHRLVFRNTPLLKVSQDLKDYFQVDFVVTETVSTIPITATFHNDSLEQVITELRLLTGLRIEITGKSVTISK